MRFTSQTSYDGVVEQTFALDGIPGVLWTPQDAAGTRPLIVIGHGGGQHKKAPGVVARAACFAREGGFAVVAIDAPNHGDRPEEPELTRIANRTRAAIDAGEDPAASIAAAQALMALRIVPEWRALLDAVVKLDHVGPGPVGYWGMSMGCGLGVPFVAAENRVRAAVFGLGGASACADDAARITVPVEFLVQWDDERVPRAQSLALFDAFGSAEKTLHANPGGHADLPHFETDGSLRFFQRHLTAR